MTGAGATPPAGWLIDPADPSLLRWWDGAGWSDFRRPRDTPPPPSRTQPEPTAPASPTHPPVGPTHPPAEPPSSPPPPPASPTSPEPPRQPPTSTGPPHATAWTPGQPEVVAPTPPRTLFSDQWDATVGAVLGALDPGTRTARAEVHHEIRATVLAAAAPDEEVLGAYAVALHDPDAHVDRLGLVRALADLVVTDHRLLVVGHWVPQGVPAFVSRDIADVLLVTALQRTAVRVDFDDDTVLLLRSLVPGAHSDLVAVLDVLTAEED